MAGVLGGASHVAAYSSCIVRTTRSSQLLDIYFSTAEVHPSAHYVVQPVASLPFNFENSTRVLVTGHDTPR
jgi:hypothetical protein